MAIVTKKKNYFGIYLLLAVLGVTSFAETKCTAQETQSEKVKSGMQVTVLLYSGRLNPTFVLDDEASIDTVKKLFSRSKALETFKKETVVPSILGYNGIVVENVRGTIEQFPVSLIIYKGIVEVKNSRKYFQNDEANEIESFLLKKAMERRVINEETLRKIKASK